MLSQYGKAVVGVQHHAERMEWPNPRYSVLPPPRAALPVEPLSLVYRLRHCISRQT